VGFIASDVSNKEPKVKVPDRCYEWRWFELNGLPNDIFIGRVKQIESFLKKTSFFEE
jgi:hypothetical protein